MSVRLAASPEHYVRSRMTSRLRAVTSRPLFAAIFLLLAYVALSFLNDTHGYLGTDTGGKTATLEAMSRSGSFDPDVGYWAKQWDPEGRFHPLYYTSRVGDRFLNVTTLPMVLAAEPLWRVGGYRAALLLPMLGSVAAAFAARAIAERLVPGRGSMAFWVTGLAGSAAIYALDFWEHSIGLALMGWGIVALLRARDGHSAILCSGMAGLAFGAAFTMRTEAAVFAFVAVGSFCIDMLWRSRSLRRAISIGLPAVAGAVVAVLANLALEQAVIGESLRTSRAAGAASGGGTTLGLRLREGLTTSLSPRGGRNTGILFGALTVLLLAYGIAKARRGRAIADAQIVIGALGIASILYVLDVAAHRLGFVPGFVIATPFAVVALLHAWSSNEARLLALIALGALPLVWLFQFPGGAVPQWGGRYVLTSALLLGAVGVAMSVKVHPAAVALIACLSVFITAVGIAWLVERSHEIDAARRDLVARPEPVLISDVGFWFREFGPEELDHRWLSVGSVEQLPGALQVAARSGAREVGLVSRDSGTPIAIGDWRPVRTASYRWLDAAFRVVTYTRS